MRRFIVKRQQTKRLQKRFVSNDSHVVEKNVNVLETVPQIENVEDAERENAYNSITNKEESFEYMCKYYPSLKKIDDNKFIRRNATFKELSEKYNFSIEEFKEYRADFLLRELEVNND